MTFNELEQVRQAYAKKIRTSRIVVLVCFLVIFGFSLIYFSGTTDGISFGSVTSSLAPALFMVVVAVVITMFASRKDAEAYRKAYKAYFVEQNLKQTFTEIQYDHKQGMDRNILRETGMLRTGDNYYSNDLVLGQYKSVRFAQADVKMEDEYTDSDGNRHTVTIFKGRWMIFQFPKKFDFRLAVVAKNFNRSVMAKKSRNGRKLSKISVESTEFNKKYIIYGEDGFEAFYILDPAFIEKIEKLGETYQRPFILCFVDNKLHVGLYDGRDSFEPPRASRPIDEKVENEKIAKDIKVITDFVDGLSLDKKLFGKG